MPFILPPNVATGSVEATNLRLAYLAAQTGEATAPVKAYLLPVSAAGLNRIVVCDHPCDVMGASGYNNSVADRYLKIYDKNTLATVGTDTPVGMVRLAANSPFDADLRGLTLIVGVSIAITALPDLTDATVSEAGDIIGLTIFHTEA